MAIVFWELTANLHVSRGFSHVSCLARPPCLDNDMDI